MVSVIQNLIKQTIIGIYWARHKGIPLKEFG